MNKQKTIERMKKARTYYRNLDIYVQCHDFKVSQAAMGRKCHRSRERVRQIVVNMGLLLNSKPKKKHWWQFWK